MTLTLRHDRPSREERPARPRVRLGHEEPRRASSRRRRTCSPTRSTCSCRARASSSCARFEQRVRAGQAGHDAFKIDEAGYDRLAARRHDRRALRHASPQDDTSKTPTIKLLVANGHASSLYHMAPSDSGRASAGDQLHRRARRSPSISTRQKVATVTAVDSVPGVFIEPKPDSTRVKRRNAAAQPDKPAVPTTSRAETPATPPATPPAKPPAVDVTSLHPRRAVTGPSEPAARSRARRPARARRSLHRARAARAHQRRRRERRCRLRPSVACYRDDHLGALRASGHDADREAGRLSLDEVRQHLATSVLPRLAADGVIVPPPGPATWTVGPVHRSGVAGRSRRRARRSRRCSGETGEHPGSAHRAITPPVRRRRSARPSAEASSKLADWSRPTAGAGS